ncbi:MAG TPA: hypothetical protein VHW01_13255, partial [Polyangiaceae bacterium]|nr:hypothetical protein [Polyangiaceae bacterium]
MLKLPWTPKPRTASLEELREQLANAKASHAEALKATGSAQATFDDAGDTSAEKALTAARAAEQSASEHLARAQRLASAAEARRKAEERAELEREATDLESELGAPDPEEVRLVAAEVAAYTAAVTARLDRYVHNQARIDRKRRLHGIRRQLGHDAQDLQLHSVNPEPNHAPVAE